MKTKAAQALERQRRVKTPSDQEKSALGACRKPVTPSFTLSPHKKIQGRKSKLSEPKRIRNLRDALVAGNTYDNACKMAGIARATFYRWLSEADHAPEGHPLRDFRDTVKRAEAFAEHRCIVLIQNAAQSDWRAAAWWLERVRREDWARKRLPTSMK